MRRPRGTFASVAIASALLTTCTNASVFATSGEGPEGPDRAIINGTICAPVAAGPAFPVKVLFIVEGGPETIAEAPAVTTALGTVGTQTPGETLSLAFEAFHTTADSLLSTFSTPTQFQMALLQYPGFQETGPVSIAEGLEAAENILTDDFQSSCKGALARTHYVVAVVFTSEDESCTNPVYAEVTDPSQCLGDAGGGSAAALSCVECRLTYDTLQIKTLAAQAGVGELDVVPVYYYNPSASDAGLGGIDSFAQAQAEVIANAAGSTALVIPTSALQADLTNLPPYGYGSLQSGPLALPLVLKRLYAWNENAIARNGSLEIDTDGDGLSDLDETNLYGSDPLKYDTNGDGIGDGVSVFEGFGPIDAGIVLQGCNPNLDSDGDRLNDCEELLLGTDPCQFDTDSDGFSDLVEVYGRTNPLVPENTKDNDNDGYTNAIELETHTDPNSADVAFRENHAYFATITDGGLTPDGRNCYNFQIGNIGLVETEQLPNPPLAPIDAGTNNIFIYAQMGFQGRLSGVVNMVYVQPIQYSTSAPFQTPPSPITLTPDQFITGE